MPTAPIITPTAFTCRHESRGRATRRRRTTPAQPFARCSGRWARLSMPWVFNRVVVKFLQFGRALCVTESVQTSTRWRRIGSTRPVPRPRALAHRGMATARHYHAHTQRTRHVPLPQACAARGPSGEGQTFVGRGRQMRRGPRPPIFSKISGRGVEWPKQRRTLKRHITVTPCGRPSHPAITHPTRDGA